jgi:hypothetical protein
LFLVSFLFKKPGTLLFPEGSAWSAKPTTSRKEVVAFADLHFLATEVAGVKHLRKCWATEKSKT